jgi:hypothetical protein
LCVQAGLAMTKKWYNYFVSVDQTATSDPGSANAQAPGAAKSASDSVAEIVAGLRPEPQFTKPISEPNSFEEIYRAAEIPEAPHGYSILRVAQMMESEHIRSLPSDVKKSSVLVGLEAAEVNIKDVIQDAIYRDRALDGYERVQQRALEELENSKTAENARIQAEIDRYVTEQRAKIQENNEVITREKERVTGWRLKKQQEEKKIAETVGYFVSENPITTGEVRPISSSVAAPENKTAKKS